MLEQLVDARCNHEATNNILTIYSEVILLKLFQISHNISQVL